MEDRLGFFARWAVSGVLDNIRDRLRRRIRDAARALLPGLRHSNLEPGAAPSCAGSRRISPSDGCYQRSGQPSMRCA
ncbi:hypothetical protein, partial [Actinoplanes digitatis]|uniref:hypothetical protein n=1 Tax=Actinoplanes digitatis TaxID=1868 RepID=UPI00194180AC